MSKKNAILIIIGVLIIALGLFGLSYAYWYLTKIQTNNNTISTGCLKMEFKELSDAITLNSAVPLYEEEANDLAPYSFSIKNTCSSNEYYSINLEELNDTTLNDKYVRVKLNNDDSRLLSSLLTEDTTVDNATISRNLYNGVIGANETKEYDLRIYLGGNEAVDEDSMRKSFRAKVVINVSAKNIDTPLYSIVNDLNNNSIADIGDEIAIGNQNFYVIKHDGDEIIAFAKYNLKVGNVCYNYNDCVPLEDANGLQDSTMIAYPYGGSYPRYGTTVFSNDEQKGVNYSDYSGSVVEMYVNNYVSILNSNNSKLNATGRLITKEDVEYLVEDTITTGSISNLIDAKGYQWLYSTSYWTGTNLNEYSIYAINTYGTFASSQFSYVAIDGVRPVITFKE